MKIFKALLIAWSFTIQAALPPTTLSGQNSVTKPTTFTFKAPYSQATQISGIESLIETGSENMLVNPGFEGVGATGWTCTVGTCTKTTTAGQFTSGKAALSVALSAQVMNVSQTVTTPSGIQKQGFARAIYRVPATMVDFQICTLVDAAEQTCVPTANLIKDDTFRSIEIPLTFGSTSAGIKFKTTSTYTANAYFDGAVLSQGLGLQNLSLDTVYSLASTSGGVVSGENTDWIQGNCTGSAPYTCTFKTGIFTVAPNCTASTQATNDYIAGISAISNTTVTINVVAASSGTAANIAFRLSCQKSGNDYLASSANVYSQASGNYSRRAYTPTFTGFGTVTNIDCYESRDGEFLEVDCKWTGGTSTAVEARVSLPGSLLTSSSIASLKVVGKGNTSVAATTYFSGLSVLAGASLNYITMGIESSANTGLISHQATTLGSGNTYSIYFRVPISGWSNSNVIVGSFEGIEKCVGNECDDTFSAKISSAGVVSDENVNFITGNCTNASPSVCTLSGFTVAPNCKTAAALSGGFMCTTFGVTSSSMSIYCADHTGGDQTTSIAKSVSCQKTGVDYKPKTAKVASSIGVPTVPGVTTEAIDTFSVSYGTTNLTTVCSGTPCFIDQIGTAVSSISRAGTGSYSLNLGKTYTKLRCTANSSVATSNLGITDPITCNSCSTMGFITRNSAGGGVDTIGTISCQGLY